MDGRFKFPAWVGLKEASNVVEKLSESDLRQTTLDRHELSVFILF